MKKSYRVKKEKDFQLVFHSGYSGANRQFVVYVYPKEQSHFRVGISVGKKLGNAVVRNHIKRKIRHALMDVQSQIKPTVDFIIIARNPVISMSKDEIVASLMHVFKLVHIINK